jgi:hypothetical protein
VGKVFPLSNAHIVYNEEKAMSPFEITEILSTSQAAVDGFQNPLKTAA